MCNVLSRKLVLAAFLAFAFSFQNGISAPSDSMTAGSTKLTDGKTMYFRLYVPRSYKNTIKYPVVITLHGIGECGSDNQKQVNNESIVRQWMLDSVKKKYAPFILSPQCPSNDAWGTNGGAGVADEGTVKVLDSLRKVYSLDSTRFYISGLSWGGVGTWGLLKSYPDKFAAANPCSGTWQLGGTTAPIDSVALTKTPFWASTGTADTIMDGGTSKIIAAVANTGVKIVRFASSRNMANPTGISVDSLRRAVAGGALYLWSRVNNGQHSDGWLEAFNSPLLVPWLFSKSKVNGRTVFTWPAPATGATAVDGGSVAAQAPAPSAGDLRVENGRIRCRFVSPSTVRLDVYAATGRLVFSRKDIRDNESVSYAGMPRGVYIGVLRGTVRIGSFRFVL